MEWPCRARGSGAGYAGVAVSGVSGVCASTVSCSCHPALGSTLWRLGWWRSASGARRLASAGGSQSHTARTSLRARLFSVLFLISAPPGGAPPAPPRAANRDVSKMTLRKTSFLIVHRSRTHQFAGVVDKRLRRADDKI